MLPLTVLQRNSRCGSRISKRGPLFPSTVSVASPLQRGIYIYIKSKNGILNPEEFLNGTKSGESDAIFGLSAFMQMSTNQEIYEMVSSSIFAIFQPSSSKLNSNH